MPPVLLLPRITFTATCGQRYTACARLTYTYRHHYSHPLPSTGKPAAYLYRRAIPLAIRVPATRCSSVALPDIAVEP